MQTGDDEGGHFPGCKLLSRGQTNDSCPVHPIVLGLHGSSPGAWNFSGSKETNVHSHRRAGADRREGATGPGQELAEATPLLQISRGPAPELNQHPKEQPWGPGPSSWAVPAARAESDLTKSKACVQCA